MRHFAAIPHISYIIWQSQFFQNLKGSERWMKNLAVFREGDKLSLPPIYLFQQCAPRDICSIAHKTKQGQHSEEFEPYCCFCEINVNPRPKRLAGAGMSFILLLVCYCDTLKFGLT